MALFGLFRGGRMAADSGATPGPRDRDPTDDFWFDGPRKRSLAGVDVSVERARRLPVVRDCLQVLAQTTAMLSFGIYRKEARDSRARLSDHPVAMLMANPNPRETSYEFFANMVDDLASEGRFLAERVQLPTGRERLWRIMPNHWLAEQLPDRSVRFRIREPGRAERVLLDDEVWHIPLPPVRDYIHGRSPILDDGREAIGAGLAIQAYANTFFANDATPNLMFLHKGHFKGEADKRNWLAAWDRWFGGRNRHRAAIAEYGIEPKVLGITNEQAQFLETRQETALDIARLWRMPPHKVGILDNATFSNIEHQSLEFVTDTLGPWLELIERSIWKTFIDDPSVYFEFNVASLLRGDIKTRYEAYAIGRQWGWLSVNEVRRLENLNSIGRGGERYVEPLNMVPVGTESDGRQDDAARAIAFLRQSVASNGGRPKLEVLTNVA